MLECGIPVLKLHIIVHTDDKRHSTCSSIGESSLEAELSEIKSQVQELEEKIQSQAETIREKVAKEEEEEENRKKKEREKSTGEGNRCLECRAPFLHTLPVHEKYSSDAFDIMHVILLWFAIS